MSLYALCDNGSYLFGSFDVAALRCCGRSSLKHVCRCFVSCVYNALLFRCHNKDDDDDIWPIGKTLAEILEEMLVVSGTVCGMAKSYGRCTVRLMHMRMMRCANNTQLVQPTRDVNLIVGSRL